MDPNEMQGALSTQEKPIIENIISLFQQLLSMQGADSEPAMVEAAQTEPPEEAPEQPEDIKKSSEGETGDDNAEHRLAEVTPTTDSSLNDLKKSVDSLTALMAAKKPVQKSVTQSVQKSDNGVTVALTQIAQVMKNLAVKQDTQDKLFGQMFDAMGITDEVVKKSIAEPAARAENKPIGAPDAELYKNLLTDVLKSVGQGSQMNEAQKHPFNEKSEVRKNLTGIADFIHNAK